MFTVGNVDRYIDRYVGRHSIDIAVASRSTVDRLAIVSRSTSDRQSVNIRSSVRRDVVDSRSTVDRLSTYCQKVFNEQLLIKRVDNVHRKVTKYQPEYIHLLWE